MKLPNYPPPIAEGKIYGARDRRASRLRVPPKLLGMLGRRCNPTLPRRQAPVDQHICGRRLSPTTSSAGCRLRSTPCRTGNQATLGRIGRMGLAACLRPKEDWHGSRLVKRRGNWGEAAALLAAPSVLVLSVALSSYLWAATKSLALLPELLLIKFHRLPTLTILLPWDPAHLTPDLMYSLNRGVSYAMHLMALFPMSTTH